MQAGESYRAPCLIAASTAGSVERLALYLLQYKELPVTLTPFHDDLEDRDCCALSQKSDIGNLIVRWCGGSFLEDIFGA